MCLGFFLRVRYLLESVWMPLTQPDKRVQSWETKSQSSLRVQPGGNFCFDCRLLGWHCLPFLFPFLRCLHLGAFESCSAPQLFTLHARECFSVTWEPLFPDEWGGMGRKVILNIIILTVPALCPHNSVGHVGPQGIRVSLNENIPSVGSFLPPLSSCLLLRQGLQSNGHPRKQIGTLGLCESGSLGCKVNCSFHQDKDIQMWERIKFFPVPRNRWLS